MKKTTNSKNHPSAADHTNTQKSTTLKRKYVSRPKLTVEDKLIAENKTAAKNNLLAEDKLIAKNNSTIKNNPAVKTTKDKPVIKDTKDKSAIEEYIPPRKDFPALPEEPLRSILTAPPSKDIINRQQPVTISAPSTLSALFSAQTPSTSSTQNQSTPADSTPPEEIPDIPPEEHPYQKIINQISAAQPEESTPPPTPRELKNEAIKKALKELDQQHQQETSAVEAVIATEQHQQSTQPTSKEPTSAAETSPLEQSFKRQRRHSSLGKFILAFATSAACIGVLGYFVSLNIPSISVRVAAMQTGIEASYPNYVPRDYQLSSVTTGENGAITITFAHGDTESFTLTEEKSSWDSNAVLNNYVKAEWEDDDYATLREQGITIYIHNSDAVWVNGGILYKLTARGTLTKKQIKNIALSL